MVPLCSSQDIIDTQSKFIDAERLYYPAAGGMLDDRVSPVNWLRIHFDPIRRTISQPSLWNSGASVCWQFHKAVVLERSVSDFYYQQNIGRPRQRDRVEIIAPAQKRKIGLGL